MAKLQLEFSFYNYRGWKWPHPEITPTEASLRYDLMFNTAKGPSLKPILQPIKETQNEPTKQE